MFMRFLPLLTCCLPVFASSLNLQSDLSKAGITAVFPDQPTYDNASRAFNLRFDYKPAAVTFPTSTKQVSEIVKVGNSFGLKIHVRSGGHSYIANALGNGVIVIDLSKMNNIIVKGDTAIIETGTRIGDIALTLSDVGRAIPHGTCPYVGIGGHAGHGGFGFLSRIHGLAMDTIISATAVLADGTIVTASESHNADLFWALKGSASSFAIATSWEVKTFAAPSYAIIFQYNWQLNYTLAAQALDLFQKFVKTDIPPEFGAEIVLTPGHIQGNVSFGLTGAWYGEKGGENTTVQPFLDVMPPISGVSFSGNGTWIDNLLIFAGDQPLNTSLATDYTDTFYAKSLMVPEAQPMTIGASTAFMKYLANEGFNATSSLSWFLEAELFGGSNSAINAVPLNATSFAHRDSLLTIQFYTSAPNNTPPFPDLGFTLMDGMVDSITSNMPQNWAYGAYLNYIDDKLSDWQKRYYGSHYPRLKALKRKLDPFNVFRFPESIEE